MTDLMTQFKELCFNGRICSSDEDGCGLPRNLMDIREGLLGIKTGFTLKGQYIQSGNSGTMNENLMAIFEMT